MYLYRMYWCYYSVKHVTRSCSMHVPRSQPLVAMRGTAFMIQYLTMDCPDLGLDCPDLGLDSVHDLGLDLRLESLVNYTVVLEYKDNVSCFKVHEGALEPSSSGHERNCIPLPSCFGGSETSCLL